jgi:hypothetical protein
MPEHVVGAKVSLVPLVFFLSYIVKAQKVCICCLVMDVMSMFLPLLFIDDDSTFLSLLNLYNQFYRCSLVISFGKWL